MSETATIGGIFTGLFLFLVVTTIAWKAGFFRLPPKSSSYPLSLGEVVGAFATYIFIAMILLPAIVLIIAYSLTGSLKGAKIVLPKETLIWLQMGAFMLIFVALVGYLFLIKKESRHAILYGDNKEGSIKNIGWGLLTLLVSYPTLLFVTQTLNYLTLYFFGKSGIEQSAVKQLRELTQQPLLFSFMALFIAFVVPFVEELLFRGFLQTFLRRFLGRMGAIICSSALFAFAHFAKGQGIGNVELILSLFILSCYLGFLYERQRSLFAPYGLHMAFNATTILAIAWT